VSIADACERFIGRGVIDQMFLTGGGVHNRAIVSVLEQRLEGVELLPIDELGVSADAKEAVDFAVLARETLLGRPNAIAQVTGAARSLVLGSIAPGGGQP
jgi:anhydro-N-acetylmuramic acid kinase